VKAGARARNDPSILYVITANLIICLLDIAVNCNLQFVTLSYHYDYDNDIDLANRKTTKETNESKSN
jgi:hypothetical protein